MSEVVIIRDGASGPTQYGNTFPRYRKRKAASKTIGMRKPKKRKAASKRASGPRLNTGGM